MHAPTKILHLLKLLGPWIPARRGQTARYLFLLFVCPLWITFPTFGQGPIDCDQQLSEVKTLMEPSSEDRNYVLATSRLRYLRAIAESKCPGKRKEINQMLDSLNTLILLDRDAAIEQRNRAEALAKTNLRTANANANALLGLQIFDRNPTEALNVAYHNQEEYPESPIARNILTQFLSAASTMYYRRELKGDPLDFPTKAALIPGTMSILTSSSEGSFRLWNESGTLVWEKKIHGHAVVDFVFLENTQTILTAGRDNVLYVWDLTQASPQRLVSFSRKITALAYDPSSQHFALGDDEGWVHIFTIEEEVIRKYRVSKQPIFDLSFSPDGQQILSCGAEPVVRLSSRTGKKLLKLPVEQAVNEAIFSPDGAKIAAGGAGGEVFIWDIKGELLQTIDAHKGEVFALKASSNGKWIATAGLDNLVQVWNWQGKRLRTGTRHKSLVQTLTFSKDSKHLLSGGTDGLIVDWIVKGMLGRSIEMQEAATVYAMALDRRGNIFLGNEYGQISGYRLEGEEIRSSPLHNGVITALLFPSDDSYMLSGSETGDLFRTAMALGKTDTLKTGLQGITFLKWWVLDSVFLCGLENGMVAYFNINGELLDSFRASTEPLSVVLAFPNQNQMIIGTQYGSLLKLDEAGTLLEEWEGHDSNITSIALSQDSQSILTAGFDGNVHLRSMEGKIHQTYYIPGQSPSQAVFSSDGKTIVTANLQNGVVTTYDLAGNRLEAIRVSEEPIYILSHASDGKILLAVDKAGSLHWVTPMESFLRAEVYQFSKTDLTERGFLWAE